MKRHPVLLRHWLTPAMLLLAISETGSIGSSLPSPAPPAVTIMSNTDAWGNVADGIQVSLRSANSSATVGEPLKIDLVVRNVSTKPIRFEYRNFPLPQFKLVVTDTDGNIAGLTRYGKILANPPYIGFIDHNTPIIIPPGQEYDESLWLNRLYDMTTCSGYTVTAQTTMPSPDGKKLDQVVSNTLNVNIMEVKI